MFNLQEVPLAIKVLHLQELILHLGATIHQEAQHLQGPILLQEAAVLKALRLQEAVVETIATLLQEAIREVAAAILLQEAVVVLPVVIHLQVEGPLHRGVQEVHQVVVQTAAQEEPGNLN
jgi:hypothetical protein